MWKTNKQTDKSNTKHVVDKKEYMCVSVNYIYCYTKSFNSWNGSIQTLYSQLTSTSDSRAERPVCFEVIM